MGRTGQMNKERDKAREVRIFLEENILFGDPERYKGFLLQMGGPLWEVFSTEEFMGFFSYDKKIIFENLIRLLCAGFPDEGVSDPGIPSEMIEKALLTALTTCPFNKKSERANSIMFKAGLSFFLSDDFHHSVADLIIKEKHSRSDAVFFLLDEICKRQSKLQSKRLHLTEKLFLKLGNEFLETDNSFNCRVVYFMLEKIIDIFSLPQSPSVTALYNRTLNKLIETDSSTEGYLYAHLGGTDSGFAAGREELYKKIAEHIAGYDTALKMTALMYENRNNYTTNLIEKPSKPCLCELPLIYLPLLERVANSKERGSEYILKISGSRKLPLEAKKMFLKKTLANKPWEEDRSQYNAFLGILYNQYSPGGKEWKGALKVMRENPFSLNQAISEALIQGVIPDRDFFLRTFIELKKELRSLANEPHSFTQDSSYIFFLKILLESLRERGGEKDIRDLHREFFEEQGETNLKKTVKNPDDEKYRLEYIKLLGTTLTEDENSLAEGFGMVL